MTSLHNQDLSVLHFEFDLGSSSDHPSRRHRSLFKPLSSPLLASISASPRHHPSTTLSSRNKANKSSISSPAVTPGTVLPVGLKSGLHPRKYLWDGQRLVAVEVSDLDTVSNAALNGGGNKVHVPKPSFQASLARWLHETRAAFFPNPSEVTPDYWEWCKWRAVHRMFSSMSSVFGTQSLLLAVGVGAKRTLPAAAAINWVLKDGLGRLGRLSVATRFGESFDSDLKRFRYSSSLLYAGALSLDYITPLFPQYFLPLAALANVGKSVGLTTYISTQPAFHRSFAISENLADISAKTQAQQMAVDTIGLAAAVTLSALCARHSEAARRALPLVALPFLAGGDLFAISQELRSIHLRTLNKERAEIIATEWLATGRVLSPKQVSAKERLIIPPANALGPLPLNIGGLEEVLRNDCQVERFLKQPQGQKYALEATLPRVQQSTSADAGVFEWIRLSLANAFSSGGGAARRVQGEVRAALRADASHNDVVEIIIRTAKLRKQVLEGVISDENVVVPVIKHNGLQPFVKELGEAGWQIAPFMLSSAEKRVYSTMAE